MKKPIVVMFPSLGLGHLISMVRLAELITTTTHHPPLCATILLTPPHFQTATAADYIATVSSTTPSITFHPLPSLPLPSPPSNLFDFVFELFTLYKPIVHDTLVNISDKSTVKSVIVDFLSNDVFPVSAALGFPTYYLFTGSAFGLGVMLYSKAIHDTTTESFKDLKTHIDFPGTPPVYSSDMPGNMQDRNSDSYKNIISISTNMRKCRGIIANTFRALEPRVMKALADGECIPDGPTPPTYYVGPMIRRSSGDSAGDKCCLEWLDSQPSKSVVVLIFGSLGRFKKHQLTEMAVGLEKSGQRFLWVVRNPPPEDENGRDFDIKEPNLDELLPAGFVNRVKDKGLVVKNWAPQGEILRHDSVGGFVSHCGWNSVLEAMDALVPLVAWPLYAEQKMNRVYLVEGIKVALAVEMSEEDGFVTAEEISDRVTELMEGERGREVRERVLRISLSAKAAVKDGGSSRVAVTELVESWKLGLS